MKRVTLLNGTFDPVTLPSCVDRIVEGVRDGSRGYLCTVNVAILMMMRSDPWLQRFVDGASMILADGQPLVWTSRLFGSPLPERVTGVDLVDVLSGRALAEGFGVYLLGAEKEVVEAVAGRLRKDHPGLNVCGVADGYFSAEEASARARAVADSGARILFVGMGVPRQERFLEENWSELGVDVAVGVGGSFDVIAGIRKRAPRFVQKIGFEWLFRLAQEPGRLWKRYLVTNTRFVLLVLRELLTFPWRRRAKRVGGDV